MSLFTVGGIDPRTGQYYSYVETYGGGHGGLFNQDGMDGAHAHMTNTRNTPSEVIEIAYPIRVEKYALIKDTDGPGRFRGGLGITRELTIIDHQASITIGTERREIPPWGLAGGKPGGCSNLWIESPSGQKEFLPSKVTRQVDPGTRIVLRTAGGGGYGNPFERDPEMVRRDVVEGFISPDRAKSEYGVVVDPDTGNVDEEATTIVRQKQIG
jgi:N-methylhydantoinase B